MTRNEVTLALFFGNRGLFPSSLMSSAREELFTQLQQYGYDTLMLPSDATRYGAVEAAQEAEVYANFLLEDEGKYDRVILSLPNFGRETAAAVALKDAGRVTDHALLVATLGKVCGYGCTVGRIAPQDITFGNMTTRDGKLKFYLGEGKVTNDLVPEDFFGCAGVVEADRFQDVFLYIGQNGHRHHVNITSGHVMEPVFHAFERYLGYSVVVPQKG